jgi:hypothetical protein
LKSKIGRGYRPVNRMENPATTVSIVTASQRKASTTTWGISSTHFTSHNQRLSPGSMYPSSRTEYAPGSPAWNRPLCPLGSVMRVRLLRRSSDHLPEDAPRVHRPVGLKVIDPAVGGPLARS